jgi:DNA-binding GntR family transcriptional regulator
LDALSPAARLEVLRNETVQRLVQRELERLILTGELRAGERINEVEIGRRLGVSRAPVREALRKLEEADLVCFEKHRGATVRQITVEEAGDIYELRAAVEELICRRVALRITPGQLAELRGLVARMDAEATRGEVESYHESNVQFHDRLAEWSGSREFAAFYRAAIRKILLFRRRTLGHGGAVAFSNAEHQVILRQLAARDAEAAGRAMYRHITNSGRRMQKALRAFLESAGGTMSA